MFISWFRKKLCTNISITWVNKNNYDMKMMHPQLDWFIAGPFYDLTIRIASNSIKRL